MAELITVVLYTVAVLTVVGFLVLTITALCLRLWARREARQQEIARQRWARVTSQNARIARLYPRAVDRKQVS